MIEHAVLQNSPAWQMLRAGRPTASCFHKILTKKELKLSEQRFDYMNLLLAEYVLGCPIEGPQTKFMQEGHDREDQTVAMYELYTGNEAQPCGFYTTDDGRVGASPDRRLVGINRGLEVKSPQLPGHIGYMRGAGIDDEYRLQLYGQIWVCEFEGVDITSWNEYVPASAVVIIKVNREDKVTIKGNKEIVIVDAIGEALDQFCDELDEAKVQLTHRYGIKPKTFDRPVTTLDYDPMEIGDLEDEVRFIINNIGELNASAKI